MVQSGLVWSGLNLRSKYMNFQFRVDRHWHDISGTFGLWIELPKCHQAFTFEHPQSPTKCTHTHGYVFGSISAYKTFQGNVKTAFSLKAYDYETSKTAGTLKVPLDVSGAWAYGSRFATVAPKYLKNISPDQVEELNDYARKLFQRIYGKPHNQQSVSKVLDKQDKKPSVVKDYYSIAQEIGSEYNELLTDEMNKLQRHKLLFRTITRKLHEKRICLEKKTIEKFMITILTSPSSKYQNTEDLFSEIYANIYRNS